MASNVVISADSKKISTFAVIDLETTGLPAHSPNGVSITELCIYAFDPAILKDNNASEKTELQSPKVLPEQPRVLHKLNLLFQPTVAVSPEAQKMSGLDNHLLERESRLNENAAQMILKFFEHLPAPICLVAHNGWAFDYPIIKQAFDKLNLKFPASMLCVDSLRAFMKIDDEKYAPRGRYNLVSLFERTFALPASDAHQAEGDVNMLTKLIQHYGLNFLTFAEEQAIPMADVVPLR